MENNIVIKVFLFLLFFVFIGVFAIPSRASALSAKGTVEQCLEELKKGKYTESYEYFSESLKNQVSLEHHISNLKNIEGNLGNLISYQYETLPIFKNNVLDEDMFSNKNKVFKFNYLLKYEKGSLTLHVEVIKEKGEYKFSIFYLEPKEEK